MANVPDMTAATARPAAARTVVGRHPWLVLLAVFVVVNLGVLWLADPGCRTVGAECALATDRYGVPVIEALVQHGALVEPADPSQPYTSYVPGHALTMAATFLIFGDGSYLPLIILQLTLLFAAGLLVRMVVDAALPGYGWLALALLIFNPNVLVQVHLVQPDAIEIFFVTGAFAAAAMFARGPSLRLAVLSGGFIGLAMWMFPMSQFLAPLLPVVLPLLCLLGGQARQWRRAFLWGAVGAGVAIGIASPWMYQKYTAGAGFKISSPGHEHLVLLDSLRNLSPEAPGRPVYQLKEDFLRLEEEALREANPGWDTLTTLEQDVLRRAHIVAYYKSFPFETGVFLEALAWSWGRFLLAGGEGEIHRLLGLEGKADSRAAAFYFVKGVALSYALLLRLIGLIGIFEMVRRGHWGLLLLCAGLVFLFMAGTFLVGQPRFRLSVEPQLMIFATFGLAFIAASLRSTGTTEVAHLPHPPTNRTHQR